MTDNARGQGGSVTRRWQREFNLALFLVGIVTIGVVVNFFAARPGLRLRIDATKTRAYSLSEQTRRLLAGLSDDWTIAMVMVADSIDQPMLRQVNEVLTRYTQASPHISVVRIDPTDPRTLGEYEDILAQLRLIYQDQIAQYERLLEQGHEAVESFTVFLQQQTGRLDALRQSIEAADPHNEEIDQLLQVLALRLQQTEQVQQNVKQAMRLDESRPLPDYETARSVLAAALRGWADEQYRIVQMFNRWRSSVETSPAVRQLASDREAFASRARQLALVADGLKHLAPLELGRIARAFDQGEAAIVIGPQGAVVVPSSQLFSKLNLRKGGAGEVTFDQRFRGEQAISAAIRSQLVDHMPMVVFIHAQDESMVRRRDRQVDLVGATNVLKAARFEVQEWVVGKSDTPVPAQGQPMVWIVVPSPARQGLEPTEAERALIAAVRQLLADGEPVLLSVYPSRLPGLGRPDPWQAVVEQLGLQADTARVVYEQVRLSPQEVSRERGQAIRDFRGDHPIAKAIHGQQTYFALPVPIRSIDEASIGGQQQVIADIASSPNRWLEKDWAVDPQSLDDPKPDERFLEPVPIVVAVERLHPLERGRWQRSIVVGSGGWMLSYIADVVIPLGGDRVALANPGNYELLLSSVAWLAQMDELIAPSPISQQVARLDGITPAVQRVWWWAVLAGMPGGCLMLGVVVWVVRRR